MESLKGKGFTSMEKEPSYSKTWKGSKNEFQEQRQIYNKSKEETTKF